ncbi:PWI domain-containing protein [Corynascus novoguineensis]|uniref:PWI domain-containing protein n=1 Tax=Corynascus novoguineensis TaxID=1126955 RepID=A0AAN7D001_9PEZI|nr:PWI domain-containing protein [Corynascus novoguineensis]
MATGVDAKLLKSTKFPPEFNQKVDMQKVNVQVMKKWIANRVTELLGNEDDVVIELVFNLVEGVRHPDIKSIQIQLTGFLDKDTPAFCKELWKLLLSAQASPQGVPKELLEAKKLELMQEKMEADKAAEEARRRREEFERRDRGRGGRGGGGGGGGGGPGRGDSWREVDSVAGGPARLPDFANVAGAEDAESRAAGGGHAMYTSLGEAHHGVAGVEVVVVDGAMAGVGGLGPDPVLVMTAADDRLLGRPPHREGDADGPGLPPPGRGGTPTSGDGPRAVAAVPGAESRRRSSRDEPAASSAKQDSIAANELREMELMEKIKKMRSSKSGDDNVEANAA